jgi:bacterioferritin-associated ferredoxin
LVRWIYEASGEGSLMYVCLCVGATSQNVSDAVADGASTSKEVAAACGAGTDCGRCRRTLRAIIAAAARLETAS